MPLCCSTNIQACIVLGITHVIFSLIYCFGGFFHKEIWWAYLTFGLVKACLSGLLIYAAYARKINYILISITLKIFDLFADLVLLLHLILMFCLFLFGYQHPFYSIILVVCLFYWIIYQILIIIAGENARKEIVEEIKKPKFIDVNWSEQCQTPKLPKFDHSPSTCVKISNIC